MEKTDGKVTVSNVNGKNPRRNYAADNQTGFALFICVLYLVMFAMRMRV